MPFLCGDESRIFSRAMCEISATKEGNASRKCLFGIVNFKGWGGGTGWRGLLPSRTSVSVPQFVPWGKYVFWVGGGEDKDPKKRGKQEKEWGKFGGGRVGGQFRIRQI